MKPVITQAPDTETRHPFGEYVLDVAAGLVWHGDRRIELRPQTFAVLEHLVRHADELVEKESLLTAVWGDRVVTDDSIIQCISEIRSALGEPGQTQLQTVPRRGYRLEVASTGDPAASVSSDPGQGKPMDRRWIPLLVLLALGVAMLWMISSRYFPSSDPGAHEAAHDVLDIRSSTEGAPGSLADPADALSQPPVESARAGTSSPVDLRPSLAVLPFIFRGPDEHLRYLAAGFHDDLLTALAQSDNLRVISRTSVMGYDSAHYAIPRIGEELGVDHLLEGSLEITGGNIRINAQLIEARSDTHQWARTFDRAIEPGALFALRNELSQQIAQELEAELRLDAAVPTLDPIAQEAYRRGRQALFRGGVEQLKIALDQFEQATKADPDFADAWVGIADAHTVLAEVGESHRTESLAPREQAISRALAINPDHASAHAAHGWLNYHKVGGGNPEAPSLSVAAFKRAIALNPNDARTHMGYALLLNLAFPERLADAVDLLEKARRLDPRSSTVAINLAATYRFLGVFDPAERLLLDTLHWAPENIDARRVLARLYLDWGRLADARRQAEEALAIDGQDNSLLALVGETALELRDLERAQAVWDALRDLAPGHPETLVLGVKLLDRRGDGPGVEASLEAALERFGPRQGLLAFGVFMYLLQGDVDAAVRWQAMMPAITDEAAWPNLIRLQGDFACVMGWVGTRTKHPESGRRLVSEARHYLVSTLPASRDHVDRYRPEVCHLAADDPRMAVAAVGLQAAHRHIGLWDEWHRLPLYDPIRQESDYQTAWARRERLIEEERRLAGLPVQPARENAMSEFTLPPYFTNTESMANPGTSLRD